MVVHNLFIPFGFPAFLSQPPLCHLNRRNSRLTMPLVSNSSPLALLSVDKDHSDVVANDLGDNSSKDASPNLNPNPSVDLHSETEARERFESWCKKFGRTYSSKDEELYRFSVFKETLERVTRDNKELQRLGESLCFGLNNFSDQTLDETDYLFAKDWDSSDESDTEEHADETKPQDEIQA